MRFIVAAVVLVMAGQAYGEDQNVSRETVKKLCQDMAASLFSCQLSGDIALTTAKRPDLDNARDCIRKAKESSRGLFETARNSLESRPPVLSAVKDLYVAFLTVIDATTPRDLFERHSSFMGRVDRDAARIKEMCVRIDLDL